MNINELRLQRPDVIEIARMIKTDTDLESRAEKCFCLSSASSSDIISFIS